MAEASKAGGSNRRSSARRLDARPDPIPHALSDRRRISHRSSETRSSCCRDVALRVDDMLPAQSTSVAHFDRVRRSINNALSELPVQPLRWYAGEGHVEASLANLETWPLPSVSPLATECLAKRRVWTNQLFGIHGRNTRWRSRRTI